MGRSVETPTDATTIFFHHWDIEPEDYDIAEELFADLIDTIRETIKQPFPSFDAVNTGYRSAWGTHYRETSVILENGHAFVTIAEYCGLVAVSLVPKPTDYDWFHTTDPESYLHEHWCNQIADKFMDSLSRCFGGRLRHVATFSNGEAVFEHTGA